MLYFMYGALQYYILSYFKMFCIMYGILKFFIHVRCFKVLCCMYCVLSVIFYVWCLKCYILRRVF